MMKCLQRSEYWAVGKVGRHFSMREWCGRAQPIVGVSIPRHVLLGTEGKQAEQTMKSKTVSCTFPRPLHQLLPPGSYPA